MNCDLKQIDWHIFHKQRQIHLGSLENFNSGRVTLGSLVQVLWQGKENAFIEGAKEVWRTKVNKVSMLFTGCEPLRRDIFLLHVGLHNPPWIWELPLLTPNSTWGFWLLIFYIMNPAWKNREPRRWKKGEWSLMTRLRSRIIIDLSAMRDSTFCILI